MAVTTYTYSVSGDFPNGKVHGPTFTKEIQASSITIALEDIVVSGDDCDISFKAALAVPAETNELNTLVSVHQGVATNLPDTVDLVTKTASGKPVFSQWPTEGNRKTIVTHNYCDPTTWYTNAVRVVEESLDANTAGEEYAMDNQNVIDAYHGKIWEEDSLLDGQGNSYLVTVEIDTGGGWTSVDEVDPHSGTGDYTVDYAAGTITFSPTIDTGASVRATYHYATDSVFSVAPSDGRVMDIKHVEAQFSTDLGMTDSIIFAPYGYVQDFAPQLTPSPYPEDTLIPLGQTKYKSMRDFHNEVNGALPTIPALGGNGWRGVTEEIVVFRWEYAATLQLENSKGMEIRVYLEHDVPFTGTYATATIYALQEDEE